MSLRLFNLDRLLLIPTALLALTVSNALASSPLSPRADDKTNTTIIPAPISITPDENWDGIDGSWSSFTLRIGTPEQTVRTFISFAGYQTWAVLPQGCQAASDETTCADVRGGLYNETASSTFDEVGIFDLALDTNLGYTGNAIYGYDTVGLGGVGEEGPTLKNTTVGGFAVEDYYLGMFGVNPKPTNFSTFADGSPSYMTLLKDNNSIPSVSAAYTAGAKYRYTGVLASLVLGGYDTSRFVDNDLQFVMSADNSRDIVVAIQSISTESQLASNPTAVEMLPNPIYAYIDSTVPQIWLPKAACALFEEEFGIVYDNTTDLYLVDDALHSNLTARNPNITFALGQDTAANTTIQITLPYAAFDLTAQPPYQGLANNTLYFPLRRAANDSQYTLGRTFLQEAYLSVNWDTQRFNVSQVKWSTNYDEDIIPMAASLATSNPSSASRSSSLSAGAIAGLVVGIVVVLAALAALAFWLFRRRSAAERRRRAAALGSEKLDSRDEPSSPEPPSDSSMTDAAAAAARGRETTVFPKAELEGSHPTPPPPPASSTNHLSMDGSIISPNSAAASSSLNPFSRESHSSYSPVPGEGTHSSTDSNTHSSNSASNTYSSGLSPLSPSNTAGLSPGGVATFHNPNASEADSKHLQIYEMAGDMPAIREKDGRALSEKEALMHREKLYNGVDSAPNSNLAVNHTDHSEEGGEAAAAGALPRYSASSSDDTTERPSVPPPRRKGGSSSATAGAAGRSTALDPKDVLVGADMKSAREEQERRRRVGGSDESSAGTGTGTSSEGSDASAPGFVRHRAFSFEEEGRPEGLL